MFSGIIDCDPQQKHWVEIALEYLPCDIHDLSGQELVFISLGEMDACRLPYQYRGREIIFLSDRIFPLAGAPESDLTVKYFIFTVLHEVAHAIKRHKSPSLDRLTREEWQQQEDEADQLASEWFNNHVQSKKCDNLNALKPSDLEKAKKESSDFRKDMEKFKIDWRFARKGGSA